MAENSKIEWTHHTFNPWRGCTKISAGCTNCYAETLSHRNPKTLGVWGDKGTRVIASEAYWREPIKWNAAAVKAGERHRVFCASLADVFEDRPELDEPRQRLFDLILQTPQLDWLLLTKRPEVMREFLIGEAYRISAPGLTNSHVWDCGWPNVWLGVSVEDQAAVKARGPILLSIPAAVHFLSVEPLLGPIDAADYLHFFHGNRGNVKQWPCGKRVAWVIVGGESGHNARPMHPEWARSLRDQCTQAGVPFFFKQWGEFVSYTHCGCHADEISKHKNVSLNIDGRHLDDADDDTQAALMVRVGKKAAGRELAGRSWDEFPKPRDFSGMQKAIT